MTSKRSGGFENDMERASKPGGWGTVGGAPLNLFDPADPVAIDAANFFFVFSRFEYSLKRAGFTTLQRGKATPDWDAYADCLDKRDFDAGSDRLVKEAVEYLSSNPPRRQTINDGVLSWDRFAEGGRTKTRHLLLLLRRTRNNLFHGGKFPLPDGPVPEPARDTTLLRSSLIVLYACLQQSPQVSNYFWEEYRRG